MAEAEREISGLRSLKHPMICGIIDIVKDKDNHPCIIMEKRQSNGIYAVHAILQY